MIYNIFNTIMYNKCRFSRLYTVLKVQNKDILYIFLYC